MCPVQRIEHDGSEKLPRYLPCRSLQPAPLGRLPHPAYQLPPSGDEGKPMEVDAGEYEQIEQDDLMSRSDAAAPTIYAPSLQLSLKESISKQKLKKLSIRRFMF